jgi:uncharacterized protein YjbI with pentapeptide repeats
MKFQIKHRWHDSILFEGEFGSLKLCVEAAICSHADLPHADLFQANLSHADLSQADLSYADLFRADLLHADLSHADLSHANLSHADLSYANLSRAKGVTKYLTTPLLMLLDQPGLIRAYKLVTEDGRGPKYGGITYEVGKSVEVDKVDTNEDVQCGAGISLATLDWCLREHQSGYRILVCEFTAADIVAIPTATDGKFRVRGCKVVEEKDVAELLGAKEDTK